MQEEIKHEFSQGYVSGTALGDLQLLRHAIQAAKYMAWDMKLDTVGGQKALEIMDEFHSGKYGSKDGIWVQAKNALDALEKLLKQENINPKTEIYKNVEKRRKIIECASIMNEAIEEARDLCENMVFLEVEMHVIEAAKEYGRFLQNYLSDEKMLTDVGRKELSDQKVKLEANLIERIMMMQL